LLHIGARTIGRSLYAEAISFMQIFSFLLTFTTYINIWLKSMFHNYPFVDIFVP
jgi:hypothetical protein